MSLNVTAAATTFMNVVGYASMSLAGMNTTLGCPCAPEGSYFTFIYKSPTFIYNGQFYL
jgi:hypothetical protein